MKRLINYIISTRNNIHPVLLALTFSVLLLVNIYPSFSQALPSEVLLAKGDTLLAGNQPEKALAIFEKVYNENFAQGKWDLAFQGLYHQVLYYIRTGNLKNAALLTDQAESLLNAHLKNDTHRNSDLMYLKGSVAMRSGDNSKALEEFRLASRLRKESGIRDSLLYKIVNNLGYVSIETGDFFSAEQYLKEAITIAEEIYGTNDPRTARPVINLASLYTTIGDADNAIKYLDRAENVAEKLGTPENLAVLYMNKAIILKQAGDIEKSLRYYMQSLHLAENNRKISPQNLVLIYNNIGSFYDMTGNINESTRYYFKALTIAQSEALIDLPIIYMNLGINFSKNIKCTKAEQYFNRALQMQIANSKPEHYRVATIRLRYGELFLNCWQNIPKAINQFHEALRIAKINYGEKNTTTAMCYHDLGLAYEAMQDYPEALKFYQKAIISYSDGFDAEDPDRNPKIENIRPGLNLIETLKHKGLVLNTIYHSLHRKQDLVSSLNTFLLAESVMEKIRQGYSSEQSKVSLVSKEAEIYEHIIDNTFSLWKLTGDYTYLQLAFETMERSKASTLLSSIRNIEASEFGGIPAELSQLERRLKREISFYQENIYEEKRSRNPDQQKITTWEQILFRLNQRYDSLVRTFEQQYPNYYTLKFDNTVLGLDACRRRLKQSHAMLQYSLSDSVLYTLMVSYDTVVFTRIPSDSVFTRSLHDFLQEVSFGDFTGDQEFRFKRYTKSGRYLFGKLIEPYIPWIKDRKIIVVPNEQLAYLPFEALLTDSCPAEINYRKLPYMVRKYTVSYTYSATLLSQTAGHFRIKARNTLLAVAPQYAITARNIPTPERTRQYIDNLYPIPGAREEAVEAQRIFHGKLLIDREASEENFKRLAGKYDLLHLSMHTIIDDADPMFSKLAFTRGSDSAEDGLLNTYEIYNLRLKCQLAVLSSCNTGKGKMLRGEGVMSLARAFIYAGCPSIVMSLWEVEDKTSVGLMGYFYKYLWKGKTKSDALRLSKTKYLAEADPLMAHPYFWGGFVFIGDDQPLAYPTIERILTILIALVFISILLAIGVYHRRKLKKKKAFSSPT